MVRADEYGTGPSGGLTHVAEVIRRGDERADDASRMVGTTLGVYRLDALVGSGAVGMVYRGWDSRSHRVVALKVLRAGVLATASDRDRFRQEAVALGRLSHANVTAVFDFGYACGRDYLVMEFVPGWTLSDLLEGGPMASGHVAHLGEQLAHGLTAAHRAGFVHRDIKPQNLRLTPDGLLKILDFGLARNTARTVAIDSADTGIFGTVPYMAPEQVSSGRVDARTDVYAAGTVLYEMACGCRPFVAETMESLMGKIRGDTPRPPSMLNPAIWPSLEVVILRALAKDPAARPASAHALAVALARARAPATPSPLVSWMKRWRRMAASVAQ